MIHSTKIESIRNSNGFKLIAFSYVLNFKKCKPQTTPCFFADFKDNVLRFFEGSEIRTVEFMDNDFKRALQYIRNK